ncbi:peptidoglycan DD-metalloendopeptidase family protein [Flavicella sp.]|uniref:murein hydrolase activator EnvC family protein n=1 Tax=Flavicella sp. TaxID=2957742 RepID=UPI00301B59ED
MSIYTLSVFQSSTSGKRRTTLAAFVFFAFYFFCLSAYAQEPTQKSLESKRARLQLEIKKINSLLFNSKAEEKNILNEVSDLNRKIEVRSRLIRTIHQETAVLNKNIKANQTKTKELEKELLLLKEDYATMIFMSYKSKSTQSRLLFILSSESFYQGYKRFQYMTQYTEFRKDQGYEIVVQTEKLKVINDDLKVQKIEKQNLISEQKEEQSKIEIEKKQHEYLAKEITTEKKKYTTQIKKKQKEERIMDRQIEKLIRNAISTSNKKNSTEESSNFILTPEAKELTSKFTNNKGKLPWPVNNALVVRKYGKIPHESVRGITIQSNGIHIATDKKARAKAVFEGTVLAIQVSSSGMKTVYIQHGNYISLYSNLETVSLQKGDNVSLQQSIGEIHTDKVTGKTLLKFQIWRDTKTENPTDWLLRL